VTGADWDPTVELGRAVAMKYRDVTVYELLSDQGLTAWPSWRAEPARAGRPGAGPEFVERSNVPRHFLRLRDRYITDPDSPSRPWSLS